MFRGLQSNKLPAKLAPARRREYPASAGIVRGYCAALVLAAAMWASAHACPFCDLDASLLSGIGSNVYWLPADSVAACPAADTLILGSTPNPHPSVLRINVWYDDANCVFKVGVPPDSIYVTWTTVTGNLRVNDKGARVYADDSTDACGHTRVTIPSFSGCGKLGVTLYVSGQLEGRKNVVVRTVDTDADGRVTSADTSLSGCDIDYVGGPDAQDRTIVLAHTDHWHRNALHGTLVRRTNFCGNPPCQGTPGTIGESQVFWSPSGRWLAFTAEPVGTTPLCKVYVVASDPKDGDAIRRVTFASPVDSADYDPSWSPLGQEISFGRFDNTIYRKGIPGFSPDTNTYLVTFHDDLSQQHRGDLTGSISPDGQWVAFSRRSVPQGPYELFKIPINGDTTKRVQLTSHPSGGTDYYPQWSPDGRYVIFQRSANLDTAYALYRVRADGTGEQAFYEHSNGKPYGYQATTPAYSPDGRIVLAGIGPSGMADSVVTHTIDTTLTTKKPIKSFNYNDAAFAAVTPSFPILSPRLSPDGTRLTLGSSQLWAARRNMSLPPRITQVGTQGVVDSTAKVSINAARGLQTTVQVLSTDPEGDPISCSAYFLQDGMTFSPSTCTLTWTPSLPVGTTVYVKFQVTTNTWPQESGGSDQIIAAFTVVSASQPHAAALPSAPGTIVPDGPNPTRGRFALTSPLIPRAIATMIISDVAGRRVAVVRGPSGAQLVWDGNDRRGARVGPGIYLYRLEAGAYRKDGKVVVLR